MTQELKGCTALSQGQSLLASILIGLLTITCNKSGSANILFWPPWAPALPGMPTTTHIHTIKNKTFKKKTSALLLV